MYPLPHSQVKSPASQLNDIKNFSHIISQSYIPCLSYPTCVNNYCHITKHQCLENQCTHIVAYRTTGQLAVFLSWQAEFNYIFLIRCGLSRQLCWSWMDYLIYLGVNCPQAGLAGSWFSSTWSSLSRRLPQTCSWNGRTFLKKQNMYGSGGLGSKAH